MSLAQKISALHFELGRVYQKPGMSSVPQSQFEQCADLNATHSSDAAETPNLASHD